MKLLKLDPSIFSSEPTSIYVCRVDFVNINCKNPKTHANLFFIFKVKVKLEGIAFELTTNSLIIEIPIMANIAEH